MGESRQATLRYTARKARSFPLVWFRCMGVQAGRSNDQETVDALNLPQTESFPLTHRGTPDSRLMA